MPKYKNVETGVVVETIAPVTGTVWEEVKPNTTPKKAPVEAKKEKPKKEI